LGIQQDLIAAKTEIWLQIQVNHYNIDVKGLAAIHPVALWTGANLFCLFSNPFAASFKRCYLRSDSGYTYIPECLGLNFNPHTI
jgi:hypothetical protein